MTTSERSADQRLDDEVSTDPAMAPTASEVPREGLRSVVRSNRLRLIAIAAAGFAGGVAEAVFLVLIVRVIFSVTEGADVVELGLGFEQPAAAVLGLAALCVLIRLLMAMLMARQSARLSHNTVAHLRRRLVRASLGAEWALQQDQRIGDLQDLATSYTSKVSSYMGAVASVVQLGVTLLSLIGVAVFLDPFGAVVMILAIVVLAAVLRPVRSAIGRRARAAATAGREFAGALNDYSMLSLEMNAFGVGERAAEELDHRIERHRRRSIRHGTLSGLSSPLYAGLAYTTLLVLLAFLVATEPGDIATLGAVLLVVLRSLNYGQSLQGSLSTLASNRETSEDLFRAMHRLEASPQPSGRRPIDRIGVIEARNVSFEYEPGVPVLRNVEFVIDSNEIIGIVGPSGSGKSTLVQLLLGLRHPTAGQILVDGVDLREFDRVPWVRQVAFVPQAPTLLPASIEENLRFFRDDVPFDRLVEAATMANLHDDIEKMPERYGRHVGERGGHLSGGQQQRLTIARALVEQPSLIILDEPTASLDVRSEHLLRTTLLGLREHMTVIVIAHRLSTLDVCDRIMVIQDGELGAFDTPHQLAAQSDFYRQALELSGIAKGS